MKGLVVFYMVTFQQKRLAVSLTLTIMSDAV